MVAQRDDKGRFVKGTSGNPGGQPKTGLSITALIDQAITQEDWLRIIDELLKRAKRGNLKAIEMLMDRRFGKPPQESRVDVGFASAMKAYVGISPDDWDDEQ